MESLIGGAEKLKNADNTGGLTNRQWGCAMYGLAAGIASGINPLVGGLTTLACFLTTPV